MVPQHYVADDRRLLHAKALSFGAVNGIDLEDDVHGFMLLLAAVRCLESGVVFMLRSEHQHVSALRGRLGPCRPIRHSFRQW